MSPKKNPPPIASLSSEILIYQTADRQTRLEVRLEDETVWLTQAQMAELFQTTKQNVSLHIRNVYDEGELAREATVKEILTVQAEQNPLIAAKREVRRAIEHYNLDVIISVGYRVKSARGTLFRQWATGRLREYLVKGFAMDDERLAAGDGRSRHFEELLARVRAIRASERMFYQKVRDIFSTSEDYDAHADTAQAFFATVQNKLHWAVHGHTAAEVIARRADAEKPNMGLTSWKGSRITRADASVARII